MKLLNVLKLSRSETEVAKLVLEGLSSLEIGQRLFVCESTVKFHLTTIYRKAGVTRRAQFIVKYLRRKRRAKKEKLVLKHHESLPRGQS